MVRKTHADQLVFISPSRNPHMNYLFCANPGDPPRNVTTDTLAVLRPQLTVSTTNTITRVVQPSTSRVHRRHASRYFHIHKRQVEALTPYQPINRNNERHNVSQNTRALLCFCCCCYYYMCVWSCTKHLIYLNCRLIACQRTHRTETDKIRARVFTWMYHKRCGIFLNLTTLCTHAHRRSRAYTLYSNERQVVVVAATVLWTSGTACFIARCRANNKLLTSAVYV